MSALALQALGYGGIVLSVLGLALLTYLLVAGNAGPFGRAWNRYLQSIGSELARLASPTPPLHVVGAQVAVFAACIAAWLVFDSLLALVLSPLVFPLTFVLFRAAYEVRCNKVTDQLDAWLLMLSNMLKASGSVANAIRSTAELTQSPLSEEVDILLKRMDVGTSLEDALDMMYQRNPSRGLRMVVTSLRVGRRLGGDLPTLLAENAAALREAKRIDGYIRSQVASGKSQLVVLAVAPIAFVYLFTFTDETFFDPLLESPIAPYIVGAALALWIGAIAIGFKIMKVDV